MNPTSPRDRSPILLLAWLIFRLASLAANADEVPVGKVLPVAGDLMSISGHTAFLIVGKSLGSIQRPWVWYAPTLPGLPGAEERWMLEQFRDAGIAVAGMDVGESYGSPAGQKLYTVFYDEMTRKRGFSTKPVMLGRSRGGLMTLAWAAENPKKVGAFVGIYPVCNLSSYPGLVKAAPAYGLSADELESQLKAFNPVEKLSGLAEARVPFFAIHGDVDKLVPLELNSGLLKDRYLALGGSMQLVVPKGQGHNMWDGFFKCVELVDFVKSKAR
jgi:pimeloyl-ACP methyl ester carboxylesterase